LLVASVPCAEAVRFNMTGTEAMQAAIRIARAATGRQKLLLFQGHYDGWADSVLWNIATGSRPLPDEPDLLEPVAESLGVETAVSGDLFVVQWNDAQALERVLRDHGAEIAAVIMEPVMGNSGVIPPLPGYLESARALTTKHGNVLIFDEVITGFRVAPGGAQARSGVTPDMAVFGKAIAAGFPVACVVGRADLFAGVGAGTVLHAGTFNSNPVGMAAVVASLRILTDPTEGVYERLEAAGTRLRDGLIEATRDAAQGILIQGLPMLFNVAVTDLPALRDHADVARTDVAALRRLQEALIHRGVRIASRGNVYLSAAHTDDEIDRTVAIFHDVVRADTAPVSTGPTHR
jgi:glutamate-1-semialdehyde 2,1-aminomutase